MSGFRCRYNPAERGPYFCCVYLQCTWFKLLYYSTEWSRKHAQLQTVKHCLFIYLFNYLQNIISTYVNTSPIMRFHSKNVPPPVLKPWSPQCLSYTQTSWQVDCVQSPWREGYLSTQHVHITSNNKHTVCTHKDLQTFILLTDAVKGMHGQQL